VVHLKFVYIEIQYIAQITDLKNALFENPSLNIGQNIFKVVAGGIFNLYKMARSFRPHIRVKIV
jgi:hypothetical protein